MKVPGTTIKYTALGVVIIYVLYVLAVGLISDVSPSSYKPAKLTEQATERDRAMVLAQGVTDALEKELSSVFGWLPNDLLFIPAIIDNKTAYQSGVIYATRPASDIIAKTAARIGERDTIDKRLADATSRYFTYGENVWGYLFVYDCEGKYKSGIKDWKDWALSINTKSRDAGIYNVKSDDVYNILKYCSTMTDFALGILNDTDMSHFDSDNNIYFAKGVAKVTGNILRAITVADESVALRGGSENLQEALKRFDYIDEFNPMYVVAGGNATGDAMLPNHVAALARHLDVANNRLNDMLSSMDK